MTVVDLTIALKNEKSSCAECDVNREYGRGILAINCLDQVNSEWFCGFPCLLDFFGRIEHGQVSKTTQLLERYGVKPASSLMSADSEE